MKREGRQHGMVRTYRILPDQLNQTCNGLRFVNRIETPPAAGLFAKVSNKPTNHSKSSGLKSSNSKAKKSKRRNDNKYYKGVLVDGGHLIGASASSFLNQFYQLDESYDGDDYGSSGGVYEIDVNDLTDENYYSEDDLRIGPLTMTVVEQIIDQGVVDHHEIDNELPIDKEEAEDEEEDEIVVDEDGGSVTIGEVVVLLDQVYEEDEWCFVGADDQF